MTWSTTELISRIKTDSRNIYDSALSLYGYLRKLFTSSVFPSNRRFSGNLRISRIFLRVNSTGELEQPQR